MLTAILYGIVLILSGIAMAKSAQIIVNALTKISRFLKLSDFALSFILMALTTSLPELFVGINAALRNESVLVLGNVIGSNIVDLTLVASIVILMVKNIRVQSAIAKRDSLYMLFLGSFPLLLLIDGKLIRAEGLALIFFYLLYISRLIRQKNEFSKTHNHANGKDAFYSLFWFIIGVTLLLFTGEILIYSAEQIAMALNLPLILVGLILISIGTSLPELVFETTAIRKYKTELVLGDLMGSVITNTTLVLGITALINPIVIHIPSLFYTSALFLFIVLVLFNIFLRSGRKLDFVEGLILLFIYIVFLIVEIATSFLYT